MKVYSRSFRFGTPSDVFALAIEHCQSVFQFGDAVVCTAVMLWNVLVWAAARAKSFTHAVARLYPDTQDQTFWNLFHAHLPKTAPALERRLNKLLRLPCLLPKLAGRRLAIAIDYHTIPYYGVPKKVIANCGGGSPNAGQAGFMPTPQSVSSLPVGVTRWR